jgi:hypothetical protein
LPHDGVARHALAAAATTPLVRFEHPAGEERSLRLEPLPRDDEAEVVEPTERRQVRGGECSNSGSVGHVEVFRMGGVRTSILGRPRRLSRLRRADQNYTLI